MAIVFLSYPMNGITEYWMSMMRDAMKKNYDAVTKCINTYISNHECDLPSRLECLGEAIKLMNKADVVLFHPDWDKARGCKVENYAAVTYEKGVLYLNETRWDLFDWIAANVKKPTVRSRIETICDNHFIWTKDLFMETNISEFEHDRNIGSITIRTFKDLQKKIKEEFNG